VGSRIELASHTARIDDLPVVRPASSRRVRTVRRRAWSARPATSAYFRFVGRTRDDTVTRL